MRKKNYFPGIARMGSEECSTGPKWVMDETADFHYILGAGIRSLAGA
jgi:hypothetical protein